MFVLPKIDPLLESKELKITEAEYHSRNDLVHYSTLKHMIKSPHSYLWRLQHPVESTPSMRLGTLAHKAILEGRDFLEDYIVEPVFTGFTQKGEETTSLNCKEVKEKRAAWYSDVLMPGQKVVTRDEYDKIGFMMDSMLKHKFVQEFFKEGRPEVRGQFRHKTDFGVAFAIDFLTFDCETQLDIKTCSNSDASNFAWSVEDQKYYLQDAIYADGVEAVFGKRPKNRIWIAVENVPPYETRVHFIDALYQEAGEYEFKNSMEKLKYCIVKNEFDQGQTIIEALEPTFKFKSYYEPRLVE